MTLFLTGLGCGLVAVLLLAGYQLTRKEPNMDWKTLIKQIAHVAIESARYYASTTTIKWDDAAVEFLSKLAEEFLDKIKVPAVAMGTTRPAFAEIKAFVQEVVTQKGLVK